MDKKHVSVYSQLFHITFLKIFIKVYAMIFLFALLFLLGGCSTENDNYHTDADFAFLQENFPEPFAEYSTAPFWVWNDVVTKEKIDKQLQAFADENMYQVFVHPRPGLITEYLSEEWFELFGYTTDKAREMGMKVWIYDENSFPSGFGGGHVPAEMPESHNQPSAISISQGSEIDLAFDEYHIVLQQTASGFEAIENIPDQPDNDIFAFRLHKEAESGWYGGFSYVDLLIPGVTEKFIEVTMTGYEEVAEEDFGELVPGVFTDEPNISPRGARNSVRYSPVLFDEFQKKWGYDLRMHLPSLFRETGEYKKVRYHYYRLLLELFIERWSKPWYEYTEEKELKWTGHYWEHGWPNPHHGGDNMAMYAWHQMPGIDMLFNTFDERPDQFGNVRAVKELKSVANQMGRKRTLSETYGGSGWELTFNDMKRQGDWQAVLGVNFQNQHLSYMTLKGRRKGDFPQSFLTHAPYWDDYGELAQYFTRVQFALSNGLQINQTLILEPTSTAWMYYSPTDKNPAIVEIENSFRSLLDRFEIMQLEYDLGAENIISHFGEVNGGAFTIGDRHYTTVIIPPYFESVDDHTWELLKAYIENGGTVLSFDIPSYLNGEKTEEMQQLVENSKNWQLVSSFDELVQMDVLKEPDFTMTNASSITNKVYHMRRHYDDGQLIFWTNYDRENDETISFSIPGEAVSLLDPHTGVISDYYAEINEGWVTIETTLDPSGSKLFFIHESAPSGYSPKQPTDVTWQPLAPGNPSVEPTHLNTLTLDYLELKVQDRELGEMYFSPATDSVYHINGLESYGRSGFNPWAVAVQYQNNIIDMGERFTGGTGYEATYGFTVADDYDPEHLQAVVEWSHLYKITFNGTPVEAMPDSTYLDHSWDVIDLTDLVQPGQNKLTLSVQPMHIHAEVEPVYIRGDFSLQSSSKGFVLQPYQQTGLGWWKYQGMPFYNEGVQYSYSIDAEEQKRYKVRLQDWHGTVAKVIVNEEQVGIIGWTPYEFELTPYLNAGANEVTIQVTGSLKGLLGPHHNVNRKGIVTPWSWFYAPETQPAGSVYHFLEYGLNDNPGFFSSNK